MLDHELQKTYLRSIGERKVFPHAFIFAGAQNIGKKEVAKYFSQLLYCQEENKPCTTCIACHQVKTEIHPDLQILSAEEGKQAISIKQVRALQSHLMQSPSSAPYTIGIIEQAHSMSLGASNALLKTLEEPTGTSLIVLLTHLPDNLLTTIRSRSQLLEFSKTLDDLEQVEEETEEIALFQSLLQASHGKALELLEPLFSSKKKAVNEKEIWSKRLQLWKDHLRQVIMVKLEQTSSQRFSLKQLQESIDALTVIQTKLTQNINIRLHIEDFFINLPHEN